MFDFDDSQVFRLAVTPGEPAGIGPDICLSLALEPLPAQIVALADPDMLRARAEQMGLELRVEAWSAEKPPRPHCPGVLPVQPVPLATPVIPGQLDSANAAYVLDSLRQACRGCLDGEFDALITGPVHKGIINEAGIGFSGHTEFLAEQTGTEQVVMMLATRSLRVALVTTHLPLNAVSAAITRPRLERVIRILRHDLLTRFGLDDPRILVCGLNPHAGEGGHLGHEEQEIIQPTLEILRAEGFALLGPLPADTAFVPENLARADVVLAMYHDQGLPVLKHLGFGEAINLTLGLPIIRVSVDHGTALELAGTGRARADSLRLAVNTAYEMLVGSKRK